MEVRANLWEVVPFIVMVAIEGCNIGLTIMAKTVITRGMNQFVFVFYTNALSSIILLPHAFVCHRDRTEQPLFTFPLFLRFFFLALTGITIAQNLAFTGLRYSSPIVVIAMTVLIPAISFVLAIILRTTKLSWRSSSSQAKIIGTLISVMGATMVTLYKGPIIKTTSLSSSYKLQLTPPLFIYSSTFEDWVLGCILLAAASLSFSVWNIIQLGTVKQYPEVMTIVSFYSLIGTIQCGVVSLIAERNLSAWKLRLNMELLLIVLTAIFASVIRTRIHMWCMRMKGPFYVPMFKPFGIIFATILGVFAFANSLHFGSVMGAFIGGAGYYFLMWAQLREDELGEDDDDASVAVDATVDYYDDDKVPLLQEESQV